MTTNFSAVIKPSTPLTRGLDSKLWAFSYVRCGLISLKKSRHFLAWASVVRLCVILSDRIGDQLREFAEVLRCGCQMELILGAVRSSETQAVELQDAFEVGEEHLDLLSSALSVDIGIGLGDLAGQVAGAFIDMPGDLPGWLVRGAPSFQFTCRTISPAGVVADKAVLADPGSGPGHCPPVFLATGCHPDRCIRRPRD